MRTVDVLSREELKEELVEAITAGDILKAKVRLVYLEELISSEGFVNVDEIIEVYKTKRFIEQYI